MLSTHLPAVESKPLAATAFPAALVSLEPSASSPRLFTYGLVPPAPELFVLADPADQRPPGKRPPSQKPYSYVQAELAEIRKLLEGGPTKTLDRLVEESERNLEVSDRALAEAQARYDRSGLLDWITGRTKALREALAETQDERRSAALAVSNTSRMSQRLDGALDLLAKKQLTLALKHLQYLKQVCPEELHLDEPIRRLEALLARP